MQRKEAGTVTREERILNYNSYPCIQWFFHENSKWHPYPANTSQKLEELWNSSKNTMTANLEDITFDFRRMSSYKMNASKQKNLRRGSWFYQDKKGQWVPYDATASEVLEKVWQNGEFKLPVLISQDPRRYVELKDGQLIQFKQNKPQANKKVLRGWEGKVIEVETVTMSVITTITTDAVVSGPGSPPYSQSLQPGTVTPMGVPVQATIPQGQMILQPGQPPMGQIMVGPPVRMPSTPVMMSPPPMNMMPPPNY